MEFLSNLLAAPTSVSGILYNICNIIWCSIVVTMNIVLIKKINKHKREKLLIAKIYLDSVATSQTAINAQQELIEEQQVEIKILKTMLKFKEGN